MRVARGHCSQRLRLHAWLPMTRALTIHASKQQCSARIVARLQWDGKATTAFKRHHLLWVPDSVIILWTTHIFVLFSVPFWTVNRAVPRQNWQFCCTQHCLHRRFRGCNQPIAYSKFADNHTVQGSGGFCTHRHRHRQGQAQAVSLQRSLPLSTRILSHACVKQANTKPT